MSERLSIGPRRVSYERVRALLDVAFWNLYRDAAVRDVRAHKPTCDYAAEVLGERPEGCRCHAGGDEEREVR